MQTKRVVPVLLLMLCCAMATMLSACGEPTGYAAAPADPPVTPYDTSPGTLDVRVMIIEDQDALNHRSNISISFSTNVIEDPNYVLFDDPQYQTVICNGVTLALGTLQTYPLSVPRGEYICQYRGTKENEDNEDFGNNEHHEHITVLPYAQMFDVPLKSTLSPQLPTITSSGFTLHYTPDAAGSNCTISAMAIDLAGDTPVTGGSSSSATGTYSGPSTAGLKGQGDIILTRTCDVSPSSPAPFDSMHITYITKASVEVTWTP